MALERDYWPCPFCDKGVIEILMRPTSYRFKKSTGGKGGRATVKRKVNQEIIIVSQSCPVCNKTNEEIEKKLREDGMI